MPSLYNCFISFVICCSLPQAAHPALYPILANAWNKIFPGSLRYSESVQVHRDDRQTGGRKTSTTPSTSAGQKSETKKVSFNVQPDRTVRGSYASPPDSARSSSVERSSQQWSGHDEDIEAAAEGHRSAEVSVLGTLWSSSNSFIQLMTQRMGYDPVATAESSHGSNVEMKDNMEPSSQQQRRPAGGQVVWGPNGSLSGIMRDLSMDPFSQQASRMSSSQSSNNSYSGGGRGRQMQSGDSYNEDDDDVNAVV